MSGLETSGWSQDTNQAEMTPEAAAWVVLEHLDPYVAEVGGWWMRVSDVLDAALITHGPENGREECAARHPEVRRLLEALSTRI